VSRSVAAPALAVRFTRRTTRLFDLGTCVILRPSTLRVRRRSAVSRAGRERLRRIKTSRLAPCPRIRIDARIVSATSGDASVGSPFAPPEGFVPVGVEAGPDDVEPVVVPPPGVVVVPVVVGSCGTVTVGAVTGSVTGSEVVVMQTGGTQASGAAGTALVNQPAASSPAANTEEERRVRTDRASPRRRVGRAYELSAGRAIPLCRDVHDRRPVSTQFTHKSQSCIASFRVRTSPNLTKARADQRALTDLLRRFQRLLRSR
jgi:hypothetical protein